jgi:hypothetical protein
MIFPIRTPLEALYPNKPGNQSLSRTPPGIQKPLQQISLKRWHNSAGQRIRCINFYASVLLNGGSLMSLNQKK